MTIPNWATLGYLVAIALFILGIKQLTSARTALRGNRVAGVGMLVAIGVTLGMLHSGWQYLVPAAAAGTVVGVVVARRVAMTAMPQLVALFNGMGAGAAALIALGDFHRVTSSAHPSLDTIGAVTILLSCLIGGIAEIEFPMRLCSPVRRRIATFEERPQRKPVTLARNFRADEIEHGRHDVDILRKPLDDLAA